MFGFFNVNKPPGPTSHDVVACVRRMLREHSDGGKKVKLGHAGTLDPFASGVLVLCAGGATRLADNVQKLPKRYRAEITLGATSSTDDSEGEIFLSSSPGAPLPDEANLRAAIAQFVGDIQQTPPSHSAVHVDGQRAYKLARKGLTPQIEARGVTVHSIELIAWRPPVATIDVRCGSGTYIRALARDVGAALGTGGYCSALTRTEIGPFHLDHACTPDELLPASHLIDPMAALAEMPRVTLKAAEARRLSMGHRFHPEALAGASRVAAHQAAIVDQAGALLAIALIDPDGLLRPHKVFSVTN